MSEGRDANVVAGWLAGLQAYGGAIADVPDHDSAFSHRDAVVEFGAGTSWRDPAED